MYILKIRSEEKELLEGLRIFLVGSRKSDAMLIGEVLKENKTKGE